MKTHTASVTAAHASGALIRGTRVSFQTVTLRRYTADFKLLAGLQVSWWLAWSRETLLVMFAFDSAVHEYALYARYIVGVGFVLLR
jgi:hypothetical protein